jgi:micrococcal nuclease
VHVNKQLVSWIAVYCLLALLVVALVRTPQGNEREVSQHEQWRVESVIDGDSIVALFHETNRVRLRLHGIDAPERGQAYYGEAKDCLRQLLAGKISIVSNGMDRYGRTIAVVHANGTNVNCLMVEAGMAWHYKEFSDDSALARGENIARARRIGLWGKSSPVAPWDYRRKARNQETGTTLTRRESLEQ